MIIRFILWMLGLRNKKYSDCLSKKSKKIIIGINYFGFVSCILENAFNVRVGVDDIFFVISMCLIFIKFNVFKIQQLQGS